MLVTGLALLAGACGSDGEPAVTATSEAGPTTTSSTIAPSTSAHPTTIATLGPTVTDAAPSLPAEPAPEPPGVEDGRHFVTLTAVDPAATSMTFDLLQWFEGDEADQAAADDGEILPGEQVPNDYYVRNVNPQLFTTPYAPGLALSLVDWTNPPEPAPVDFDAWVASFTVPWGLGQIYRGDDSHYWVTVSDGQISAVEEQFLP
jgi:hypothetical protein